MQIDQQTLTDGATITWNVTSGSNASVTLGGDRTLAVDGWATGDTGVLIVKQDGTGGRKLDVTLGGSSVFIGSGVPYTASAAVGSKDLLGVYYDGTNYYWSLGYGDSSDTGAQGATGAQGTTGPKGLIGAQGTQGDKGGSGAQGTDGTQGDKGFIGAQGTGGDAAPQGAAGAKGDQGEQAGLTYTYSTSTDMAGSSGQVRFNNTTIGSATSMSIALTDADSVAHNNIFASANRFLIFGTGGNDVITISNASVNTINATRALFTFGALNIEANGTFSNGESIQVQLYADGSDGSKGAQGAAGLTVQGAAGEKGAQGTTGTATQGADGEKGAQGSAGLGTKGAQGAQGTTGTGTQGTDGAQGTIGLPGSKGAQGTTGPTGGASISGDGSTRIGVLGGNGGITGSADFIFANTLNLFKANSNAIFTGSLTVGETASLSTTVGRGDFTNDVVAYSTSDINFKENITPIAGSLDKIQQINGVEFDWKPLTEEEKIYLHGNEGHDVGVIAQEIEKVLPEVVTTRESGFKAVRYEKIIPLLIEAIKEQQKQIDSLKNE